MTAKKDWGRLISGIRYRQFGVLITTSYVDDQAYKEVIDDGHPILIVSAADIGSILRKNSINSHNVNLWLESIDEKDIRFKAALYKKLIES